MEVPCVASACRASTIYICRGTCVGEPTFKIQIGNTFLSHIGQEDKAVEMTRNSLLVSIFLPRYLYVNDTYDKICRGDGGLRPESDRGR